MATIGNLELRVGTNTLYASRSTDGYEVYEIVPKLVEFLDSTKNPTTNQYKDWFKKASKEILNDYHEGLLGGVPCEVVIDVSRKLLLHTPQNSPSFENACILLKEKYNYQILEYTQVLMRNEEK